MVICTVVLCLGSLMLFRLVYVLFAFPLLWATEALEKLVPMPEVVYIELDGCLPKVSSFFVYRH